VCNRNINTLCGQNAEICLLIPIVHNVTVRFQTFDGLCRLRVPICNLVVTYGVYEKCI
jgi:hypothetical protein